jgi:hypothetical protein
MQEIVNSVIELISFAMLHNHSLCALVAPNHEVSVDAYLLTCKHYKSLIAGKSDSELKLEMVNGSVIRFFNATNPDAMRGYRFWKVQHVDL